MAPGRGQQRARRRGCSQSPSAGSGAGCAACRWRSRAGLGDRTHTLAAQPDVAAGLGQVGAAGQRDRDVGGSQHRGIVDAVAHRDHARTPGRAARPAARALSAGRCRAPGLSTMQRGPRRRPPCRHRRSRSRRRGPMRANAATASMASGPQALAQGGTPRWRRPRLPARCPGVAGCGRGGRAEREIGLARRRSRRPQTAFEAAADISRTSSAAGTGVPAASIGQRARRQVAAAARQPQTSANVVARACAPPARRGPGPVAPRSAMPVLSNTTCVAQASASIASGRTTSTRGAQARPARGSAPPAPPAPVRKAGDHLSRPAPRRRRAGVDQAPADGGQRGQQRMR